MNEKIDLITEPAENEFAKYVKSTQAEIFEAMTIQWKLYMENMKNEDKTSR